MPRFQVPPALESGLGVARFGVKIEVCASELGTQGPVFRVALHVRSFGIAGGPVEPMTRIQPLFNCICDLPRISLETVPEVVGCNILTETYEPSFIMISSAGAPFTSCG